VGHEKVHTCNVETKQVVFLRNPANIKGMAEASTFQRRSTCRNTLIFVDSSAKKGLLTETKVMAQIEM
jgi:hypothetical protein